MENPRIFIAEKINPLSGVSLFGHGDDTLSRVNVIRTGCRVHHAAEVRTSITCGSSGLGERVGISTADRRGAFIPLVGIRLYTASRNHRTERQSVASGNALDRKIVV